MPSPGARRPRRRRGTQLDAFPTVQGRPATVDMVPLSLIRNPPNLIRIPPNLETSVELQGVIVPVILRDGGETAMYHIVDGQRRVAAARRAGINEVPARVMHGAGPADQAVATLTANMVRSHNVVSELDAIEQIMRHRPGITGDAIADMLGLSRRMVTNRTRLMGLEPVLRDQLRAGRIGLRAAVLLATRPQWEQLLCADHMSMEPDLRPSVAYLREHFGLSAPEVEHQDQIPLLPDDINEDGVGWTVAVVICDRLIQSVPDPTRTDDPAHVEDIIYRLNDIAEMLHAMTG